MNNRLPTFFCLLLIIFLFFFSFPFKPLFFLFWMNSSYNWYITFSECEKNFNARVIRIHVLPSLLKKKKRRKWSFNTNQQFVVSNNNRDYFDLNLSCAAMRNCSLLDFSFVMNFLSSFRYLTFSPFPLFWARSRYQRFISELNGRLFLVICVTSFHWELFLK